MIYHRVITKHAVGDAVIMVTPDVPMIHHECVKSLVPLS